MRRCRLLPYPDEVAGGYLVRWGNANLVVDPGLGFLLALRQAGYHLTDLDGVVVTHWHIDHTGDTEELLTSLFEANESEVVTQIDFFLAPGVVWGLREPASAQSGSAVGDAAALGGDLPVDGHGTDRDRGRTP